MQSLYDKLEKELKIQAAKIGANGVIVTERIMQSGWIWRGEAIFVPKE